MTMKLFIPHASQNNQLYEIYLMGKGSVNENQKSWIGDLESRYFTLKMGTTGPWRLTSRSNGIGGLQGSVAIVEKG